MRRGDIATVAGGVYAGKPRPALVVQDDRFDATDSLTVAPSRARKSTHLSCVCQSLLTTRTASTKTVS